MLVTFDGDLTAEVTAWAKERGVVFEMISADPLIVRARRWHDIHRASADDAVVVIGNEVWPAFSRWARAETGLVLADITEGQDDGEFYRLQHRPEPIDDKAPGQ